MADQISKLERLQVTVAGLEATLAKRNQAIQHLEAQLKSNLEQIETQKAYDRGYKAGWTGCACDLMDFTRKAADQLQDLNKVAFRKYLKGDKL